MMSTQPHTKTDIFSCQAQLIPTSRPFSDIFCDVYFLNNLEITTEEGALQSILKTQLL